MGEKDVLEAIANFQLHFLPKEWVDIVWSEDFLEAKDFPEEYELHTDNKDYYNGMIILIDAIEKWTSFDGPSTSKSSGQSSKSWRILCNKNIDYKALLCFTSSFIKTDTFTLPREQKILSLTASRLYFVLLSVPGSHAFNIFNNILFGKALIVSTVIHPVIRSSKKNQGISKTQRRRPNNTNMTADNGDSLPAISDNEKDEIMNEIRLLLDAFSKCLEVLYLKDNQASSNQMIQVLVGLSQIENNVIDFTNISKLKPIAVIAFKSFKILEKLCSPIHGEIEQTILTMMRFFLPTIFTKEEYVKSSNKYPVSFNPNTFVFIQRLLQLHEKDTMRGFKALVQQLCVRMSDKTDIRAKQIPNIVELLKLLKGQTFQDMIMWIIGLAHAKELEYRVCAIELISKLLNITDIDRFDFGNHPTISNRDSETENNTDFPASETVNGLNERNKNLFHKLLFAAILSRSLDTSPILRYKCLNIFALSILSNQNEIKEIMEELLITPYRNPESNVNSVERVPFFDFQQYFSSNSKTLPENPLPSAICLLENIEYLASDQKVFVRKSALHSLANICLVNEFWLNENRIKVLVDSCRDHSLMIRKFSIKCISDLLLTHPANKQLCEGWVLGVVPLILDNDIKCQEKVMECFGNVILNNLANHEHDERMNDFMRLPWQVLNAIAANGKRMIFRSVCQLWSVNKTITRQMLKSITTHIDTENNYAAWILIVSISEYQDYPDPKFISKYFLENVCIASNVPESITLLVVEALFLNWKGLSYQTKEDLYSRLRRSLESFTVPLTMIARYLDICYKANSRETKNWCKNLVQSCEQYLMNYIAPGCTEQICETEICQQIFTLGDAAHFHPPVSTNIINYLANIINPTGEIEGVASKWNGTVTDKVKSVAIVTLGKICLQSHLVARTYASVLANTLDSESNDIVKINAMIALSDLCIRFTSVVEDYLGNICMMLKHESVNVRKNCLTILLKLLQEDYLKPKGALFFYLLISLGDPVPDIKEMTEAFISNMLLKRNPSIMCQFFIQALFFFNDYVGPGGFNKEGLSTKERKVFSMCGVNNFNARGEIYKYMLSNMKDDHRFKLCNRICEEILEKVISGQIPLRTKICSAILKDALFAMACDEMRLENLRKDGEDSPDRESEYTLESAGSDAVLGIAKKAFISRIVKANYVESIIPTIAKLKNMLTEIKSPLVHDLMVSLRELVKDFKDEINDILHFDPELAAQVSFDLRNISREDEPEPVSDLYGDLNLREVRVSCERLSEEVLSEKLGISIASVRSLQSQSMSLFSV